MSTNSECLMVETAPDSWFYLLERNSEQETWDWKDDALTYGAFPSLDDADRHLRDNHANPGGTNTMSAEEYAVQPENGSLKTSIASAISPHSSSRFGC